MACVLGGIRNVGREVILICTAVKRTVVLFTEPPGDIFQRRSCLLGAN